MSKDFYKGLVVGFCIMFVCTSFFLWFTIQDDLHPAPEPEKTLEQKYIDKMQVLLGYIDKYYMGDADPEKLLEDSYKGLVAGLGDRYAAYYSKEEFETVKDSMKGTYCGIGAYVGMNDEGYPYVSKPITNGPAYNAGVLKGDIILEADGISLQGMELDEAVSYIRGEKGTSVKIKIKRGEEIIEFNIIRDEVESETVEYEMLEGNIGYVTVTKFEGITNTQFDRAITALENEGMKGVIIDLRSNPGGYVGTATAMLDRILPKDKLLVYHQDKDGKKTEMFSRDDDTLNVPIVVLLNGESASASELFTTCLIDYEKCTVVGEQSFGKGIMQTQYDLYDGSAIKLTTAYYYSPKGVNIHEKGITPDIEVTDDPDTEIDEQLQAAIEVFNK